MKRTTKKIVISGALGALTVFLGITNLGLIPFAGASITVLHVPVIIGAIIEGPIVGAVIGFIFGVTSMIKAAVSPAGALDPFFVNPLVSVLPRVLVGLAAYGVFAGLSRINRLPKTVAAAVASFCGSIANTALVLGALVLHPEAPLTAEMALAVTLSNGILEAVGAVIICTAVVVAWMQIGSRTKSRLMTQETDSETASDGE